MQKHAIALLLCSSLFSSALLAAQLTPPVAVQQPYTVTSPHGDRQDPYYWLRDDERQKPEVLDYLKAENAYTEAMLDDEEPVQLTDHFPCGNVQRCKQRRRAMAHVVVGSALGDARCQRQNRLSAIQCLNLALFIHAQHHRLERRRRHPHAKAARRD